MQRVANWKSWLVILSLFAAVLLGQEAARIALDAGPVVVAQDDAAAEPAAEEAPKKQSFLGWFFNALGIRYVISFGIISFTFVAVLVMNLLTLRRDAICPRHIAEAFEANLNEKKFQEAFDLVKGDDSMLSQMLAAGMQNLQQGYDKAVEAMGQVGEVENLKLEQRLSYISLIGSIAPMVGLLGTVDGMVASFMVIAASTATPKPSELAEGISMALITTLVGLVLAIPAIIAFALFKNRLTWLTMDVGTTASNLMARFEKK
ncbi:MAG: MotA/TolQ/ExbB proton channel family protein [Pirellulaceae bacterium]|nr:MotA/TolQ/ExbB proton channel family protein [Pirellulaceae bacterium]